MIEIRKIFPINTMINTTCRPVLLIISQSCITYSLTIGSSASLKQQLSKTLQQAIKILTRMNQKT